MTANRPLPDFVVIGALRAGTTSLSALLEQIDQICLTEFKEPDYFIEELNFKKGPAWYEGLFDDRTKICGDISPNYYSNDKFGDVPRRIFEASPRAKIIYVVRDPIERARSHYQQIWAKGGYLPDPDRLVGTPEGNHIFDGSRYMKQLKPYLEYFPREQVKIVTFTQITQFPDRALKQVCEFLNLSVPEQMLGGTQAEWRNSSQTLATVPTWWKRTSSWAKRNENPLIRRMAKMAPRSIVLKVRDIVSPRQKSVNRPPEFDSEVKEKICEVIRDDINDFRKWTGLSFENWSV